MPCFVKLTTGYNGTPIYVNMALVLSITREERTGWSILWSMGDSTTKVRESPEEIMELTALAVRVKNTLYNEEKNDGSINPQERG